MSSCIEWILQGIVCNSTSKRWEWPDGLAVNYTPPEGVYGTFGASDTWNHDDCKTDCSWYIYLSAAASPRGEWLSCEFDLYDAWLLCALISQIATLVSIPLTSTAHLNSCNSQLSRRMVAITLKATVKIVSAMRYLHGVTHLAETSRVITKEMRVTPLWLLLTGYETNKSAYFRIRFEVTHRENDEIQRSRQRVIRALRNIYHPMTSFDPRAKKPFSFLQVLFIKSFLLLFFKNSYITLVDWIWSWGLAGCANDMQEARR